MAKLIGDGLARKSGGEALPWEKMKGDVALLIASAVFVNLVDDIF